MNFDPPLIPSDRNVETSIDISISGTADLSADLAFPLNVANQTAGLFISASMMPPPAIRIIPLDFLSINSIGIARFAAMATSDSVSEPDETLIITLQDGSGYTLGTNTTFTLTIP